MLPSSVLGQGIKLAHGGYAAAVLENCGSYYSGSSSEAGMCAIDVLSLET
jgi:hypothetical protein